MIIESIILHSGGRKAQGHLPKQGQAEFRTGGGEELCIVESA
jgi:hypothetical protein